MKLVRIVTALVVFLGVAYSLPAQRPIEYTEYEVKAAFLYNFARFVTWPDAAFAQPDNPLVIGLFGSDPFGAALEMTIRNKIAHTRPLEIKHFRQIEDIQGCHLLFIHPSEFRRWPALQAHLRSLPILTLSETSGFCEAGGMINFILVQNRVRFEINPEALERTGLAISSRLLRLAENLKSMPREEQ